MAAAPFRLFGEISKAEEQDDGTIKVYGIASTGTKDSSGETVTSKAMADALPEYEKFPALREMHQLSAAGRVLEASVDASGTTHIIAHVVDPTAVLKVKTGVYGGFSIGGKALERDPTDRTIILKLKLNEISLVDRPCNPEAVMTMWKADATTEEDPMTVTPWSPSNADVIAKADELMTAAGKTSRSNFIVAARNDLLKAHDEQLAAEAAVADEIAKATEAEAQPEAEPDGGTKVIEKGVLDEVPAETDAPLNLVAALEAAIEKAAAAAAPPVVPAAPATILPEGFDDLRKGLHELALEGDDVRKGLYTVAWLARVLDDLSSVQSSASWEAEAEGDSSPIPAALAASVKTLGATLVAMATEEVAEMVASITDDDAIIDPDVLTYAAKTIDLAKADTDLMEKVGARMSKKDATSVQAMHDTSVKLGADCSTAKAAADDDLQKVANDAIAKATAALDDMTETVTTLNERIAELEAIPLAPKGMVSTAAAGLTVISKVEDIDAGNDDGPAKISKDDITKYLDSLPKAERDLVLVKMALSQPISAALR